MGDIENRYYQASADGVDAEPITNRRWFQMGIALTPFVLFSIVVASTFTSALHRSGAAESTNLLGLSTSLRSPGAVVVPPVASSQALDRYGLGSSPFAKLAITAIQANNRRYRYQTRSINEPGSDEMITAEIIRDTPNGLDVDALIEVNMKMGAGYGNDPGWGIRGDKKENEFNDAVFKYLKDSEEYTDTVKVGEAVKLKAQDMAGVSWPLGFFDPLGFTADCSEGKLLFYREVELKHGRVAMLASLGFLVGEQFHPLFGGNIDVPSYIAFQQTPLQTFWVAVVAAIAIPEVFSISTFEDPFGMDPLERWWTIKTSHQPGDLGFDPLGLKPTSPQEFKEMQTKELNNGRLAMIAAAGMVAQELVTGKKLF